MSVESARAFCMRLMSDDEFRDSIGNADSAATVSSILAKEGYSFSKFDLTKIVGDLMGKKLEPDELGKMLCQLYAEEIAAQGSNRDTAFVSEWYDSLA